ncbi:MAG: phosphate signaling complex protein PhoU [Paracoccaceae bacterium]
MNNESHILSAFDRDLEGIQALIMKMGGLVETATLSAAEALEMRDTELAEKVRSGDRAVDELEERVDHEAARLIALRSPTASDLRTVLAVMKTAGSLERMGDYAKNIAKRTTLLIDLPQIEGASGTVRRMAVAVEKMLRDALDAFIARDLALAENVRARDHEIDQIYNTLFRALLTHMMEDPRNITACMHLHFVAKNLERMGDHTTTIAEQVIYLITGQMPEEPRAKGDRSSVASLEG